MIAGVCDCAQCRFSIAKMILLSSKRVNVPVLVAFLCRCLALTLAVDLS